MGEVIAPVFDPQFASTFGAVDLGTPCSADQVIIVACVAGGFGITTSDVTAYESDGSTPVGAFTKIDGASISEDSFGEISLWYRVATGDEQWCTANRSSGTGVIMVAGWVWDGLNVSDLVDGVSENNGGNNTSWFTGNTGTTEQADEIAFAAWGHSGSPSNLSYNNSFSAYGSAERLTLAMRTLSSTGTYGVTETNDNTMFGSGVIATFKVGGTGATPAPSAIQGTATIFQPTVQTGTTVSPQTVEGTTDMDEFGAEISHTIEPDTIAATTSMDAVTVHNLSEVTDALDVRWSIRAAVEDALDAQWSVLAAVTDPLDLRWSVRSAIADAMDLRWSIRTAVTEAMDFRWSVRSALLDTLDLQWEVDELAGHAQLLVQISKACELTVRLS
jgi:hypothetical protein